LSALNGKKYRAWSLLNFRRIPQFANIPESIKRDIEVVSRLLPFKANNYLTDELIDWSNIPDDPLFTLVFPRREMISEERYSVIDNLLGKPDKQKELRSYLYREHLKMNPHPAGQHYNVPLHENKLYSGIQHKYAETALLFPRQGQTCHAYCTFCFRWPQFINLKGNKFAQKHADIFKNYLSAHPEITDVLITGGDPMVMSAEILRYYLAPLLEIPHLKNIRIGSKALSYWPYRFLTDHDSDELLRLFEEVIESGRHLAFMAHLNHPRELKTGAVREAIRRIRGTGAEIRSQAPLLKHISDSPEIWREMWSEQVKLGIIPYYMFVVRNTGADEFYKVPLLEAHRVFYEAYRNVSGLGRGVRGPIMSADPGKIQILGEVRINGDKVINLIMLQGRRKEWVGKPFFAKYDTKATWFSELKPALENEFFFAKELRKIYREKNPLRVK
jgi:KamA family protein